MQYFPFYMNIENKKCLIVGGGMVALRKIEKLFPFNPKITVVAPKICDEILKTRGLEIIKRGFEIDDLNNAFAVIAATDDKVLNEHIFNLCKSKNILVNTVDDVDNCTFIFPALVKKKNITLGISTSGKSPLYARFLREKIERLLDDDCDEIVEILCKYRSLAKREIDKEENRKLALERILDVCLRGTGNVDENEILRIIEDFK